MNLIEAWKKFGNGIKIVNSKGKDLIIHKCPDHSGSNELAFYTWLGSVRTIYILDDTWERKKEKKRVGYHCISGSFSKINLVDIPKGIPYTITYEWEE